MFSVVRGTQLFACKKIGRSSIRIPSNNQWYSTAAPEPAPESPEKPVRPVRRTKAKVDIHREWKDTPESILLQQKLDELQKLSTEQANNLNDLEERDKEFHKQLKRSKTAVKMKHPKPISPSLRWYRWPIYPYLHKGGPVKALTIPRKKHSGRSNTGQITVRHQGGGHKRRIRLLDFFRRDPGIQVVQRIEYDPNRSAHIALLENIVTKGLSYILATVGMRAGDKVESFMQGIPQRIIDEMGGETDPAILSSLTSRNGNCMPLSMIALGTAVHNIGIHEKGKAKLCRSAGSYGRLYEKIVDKNRAVIRLPSGEYRYVALSACATVGIVSNPDHQHRSFGKAGRSRNFGIRPKVRGVAMNKVDHPLGGGRGKSKGNKIPCSPWGLQSKSGFKTRRGKRVNRLKVRDRPRGKHKR